MLVRRKPTRARRGAALVESALVLAIFLALLFGIFEYCRFLLVLHVANNAARDGARYATVNVSKPTNFDTTAYTDASGVTSVSIQAYTTARMGGVDRQISGYQVAVYPVDPAGLAQNPPVVRSKTLGTGNPPPYPDPFNASDPLSPPWNQAAFSEKIAVTIKGTYRPLLPTFLLMPSTLSINITAVMGSEG